MNILSLGQQLAQQTMLLVVTLEASPIRTPGWVAIALLQIQLSANMSAKATVSGYVLVSLPLMSETRTEAPVPGFSLDWPWMLELWVELSLASVTLTFNLIKLPCINKLLELCCSLKIQDRLIKSDVLLIQLEILTSLCGYWLPNWTAQIQKNVYQCI